MTENKETGCTTFLLRTLPVWSYVESAHGFKKVVKRLKVKPHEFYDTTPTITTFGSIHSMKQMPHSAHDWLIGSNGSLAHINLKTGALSASEEFPTGILALSTYKDIVMVCGWNTPLQLWRNHKVIWSSEPVYRYQCAENSGLWCSFSRYLQSRGHLVAYLTREDKRLILVDIDQVLDNLEKKKATPNDYKEIDRDVEEFDMDKGGNLYSVSCNGDMKKNGNKFGKLSLNYSSLNALAVIGNYIVTGGIAPDKSEDNEYGYHQQNLIGVFHIKGGKNLSSLGYEINSSVSDQIMRLCVFEHKDIVVGVAAREYTYIDVFAFWKNKIVLVKRDIDLSVPALESQMQKFEEILNQREYQTLLCGLRLDNEKQVSKNGRKRVLIYGHVPIKMLTIV